MSDTQSWQARNQAFLGTALEWLRGRLEGRAKRNGSTGDMRALRLDAGPEDAPPALGILERRLGLSAFERDVLLLCAGMELDTRVAALCAAAQDDAARAYPTFALAMSMLDEPTWDALSPERPLRYWRLLEINQAGAQPLTASALRADERIVSFLKGLNYLDDRLAPLVAPLAEAEVGLLPTSQQDVADTIVRALLTSAGSTAPPVIVLAGKDRVGKRFVASAACAAVGLRLYRMPAENLPTHATELESLARLWQRETLLLPLALYLDAQALEMQAGSDGSLRHVQRFIARAASLVFLDCREACDAGLENALVVDVHKPTATEQRAAWETALGGDTGGAPAELAGQFNLELAEIVAIAAQTRAAAQPNAPTSRQLWRACLAKTRPSLDALAEKLEAKATWDDIVLAKTEHDLLRELAVHVQARAQVYDEWGFRERMNRGLGISALFAGESGTGKTMAAEVLANALGLDLYRIDLSAVVSKYIGETEKNLRRLFDAAENGGAILFFDEADALFGKRSDVKDSHDRYANIEINYLLQRMEAYHGLAILATNLKSALDTAFLRRLRFIVNFPFPAPAERLLIWQKAFPAGVPLSGLEPARLARFNLAGGSIHNIALNAAFGAAGAGSAVTMTRVLEAVRTELRKLERPVNEADFRCLEVARGA